MNYDLADRPCQTGLKEAESGKVLYRTLLKYDKFSNLEQFAEKVGGETHTSNYTYDRDNRVTGIQYDGGSQKVNYTYDDLGRVSSRTAECGNTAGKLTSSYTYVDGCYGTNSTTPLVKKITQNGISFEYAYDTRGNIISEKRGNLTTTYAYDALGQLIRVNDPHENATWVYNYDRGGNILSKVKYAYTTGTLGTALETIPYTYGDSNWKDKLTYYNGTTITYDAIGNPLNDGTWAYTWNAGRRLQKMTKSDATVEFKYDHNGLRVGKLVTENGVATTTNYTLHGKLITLMTAGDDVLHFFYDAQSRPAKVSYNGNIYTYLHNLQGDIIGILDNAGNLVVEYKYDAWGKSIATTGNLADTLGKRNPFRYRGYIYDEETGLYYLRSRYYNAEIGRMLNADNSVIHKSNIFGYNVFAYGCNNPIMYSDADGQLGKWIRGLVVAAVATVAVVAVTVVAASVVAAVATGAIIGAGANMLMQTLVEDKDFDEIDYVDVAVAGVSIAVCTFIPGSGVANAAMRAFFSSAIENVGTFLKEGAWMDAGSLFGSFLLNMVGDYTLGYIGERLGQYLDNNLLGGNRMQPRHYKANASLICRIIGKTGANPTKTSIKRAVRLLRMVRPVVRKVIDTLYDAIGATCTETADVYLR